MQLNPSENFIIARQLEDSADMNTYFIRAVIKDANNSTIETIDLTDRGSQFFSESWQVCSDTTGNGRWITIQTYVYTDAGYTTLSTLYGVRLDSYLVQQRSNAGLALGGGGADISYKKIAEVMATEIKKIKFPKQKDINFSSLVKMINNIPVEKMGSDILEAIQNIKFPTQKKVNLSSVISSINEVKSKIDGLPDIKEVGREIKKDIAILGNNVNSANEDVRRSPMEISRIGVEMSKAMKEAQSQFVEKTKQELARVIPLIIVNMFQRTIEDMSSAMPNASKEVVKEEKPKESMFSKILK